MSENKDKQELYPKNGEVTFLMPNTNAIGVLKEAPKGRNVTAKYMTVEEWSAIKGQEKRCFFLGLKEANDSSGKPYYLAKLHDGENPFVAAQTVLVQSLSAVPVGQGVIITCTDIVKNSNNGKTAMFEVIELKVNIFDGNNEKG